MNDTASWFDFAGFALLISGDKLIKIFSFTSKRTH